MYLKQAKKPQGIKDFHNGSHEYSRYFNGCQMTPGTLRESEMFPVCMKVVKNTCINRKSDKNTPDESLFDGNRDRIGYFLKIFHALHPRP